MSMYPHIVRRWIQEFFTAREMMPFLANMVPKSTPGHWAQELSTAHTSSPCGVKLPLQLPVHFYIDDTEAGCSRLLCVRVQDGRVLE